MAESEDSATTIGSLTVSVPTDTARRFRGGAEVRKVKEVLRENLPSLLGVVTASHIDLNRCDIDMPGVAEAGKVLTVDANAEIDAEDVKWVHAGTIQGVRETIVFPLDFVLNPALGTIQVKTLGTDATFNDAFDNGESMTLHLNAGNNYNVTWPNMRWVGGSPPVLTMSDVVTFWKVDGVLFGSYLGTVA